MADICAMILCDRVDNQLAGADFLTEVLISWLQDNYVTLNTFFYKRHRGSAKGEKTKIE